MKTFIINLKSSVDRRLKIEGQLNALSIDHEFIEAVNGKAMSTEELADKTKKINYAFLPGEIGCALSHQKIYKKMIDENIDSALILEDDVILLDGFSEVIRKITLPENSPTVILLSRVNKHYKKPLKNITVNHCLHKTQHATTAHSYIINKSGAKSLLSALYPVWMTADKWSLFEDLSLIDVSSVIPHPVDLSNDAIKSTINTSKGDTSIDKAKQEIWDILMQERSILAKFKHRYRRAITPIFHKIVNQGKG
ncbi:glycosyltransferase family 25 protein [Enterobacter asburiae]|uniref:glycosyltransferase family 25 protein n=1 Tax=Scandinavium sp. UTDF21-P1B TaxID=3446379 RepID=UPI003499A3BB